jgi:hypothetical protein
MPEKKTVRNWVFDIVLAGDILVEQNIHVLVSATGSCAPTPTKAYGTGGGKSARR